MASTYESPETVVISEAGPMVEAFKAFGDTVSTGIKRIGELRNKEAIANKKRQADLAKLAYVDSEAIFKRLQENKAGIALQNQALTLLNENAAYSASDAVDANQQKALTVKKLNGLIGYAADSELFKTNWIENQPSNIAGITEQGGKSGLNKQYWDAANIFSGVEEGDVEISFDNNGLMFYNITGAGLEKPYKTPALDFLSRSLPEVPMWNDSVKQGLVQLNLIDESTGKLTTYARKLSQEEYNKQSRGAVVAAISGYAKSSMQEVNSLGVEVFGNKDTYMEGRATGAIDSYTYNGVKYKLTNDEFNRSVIGMPEQEDLLNKALEFSFANVIPPHYGIDPKPVVKSASRKFNETIGITPEKLYKEFTENPATAWSQYLDTKLPEYDARTNIIIVPEIKEDKEKGIKPKAEESFQLSTTAGAKRFYTVLLSKYPGIGGSKEGLGFKNKFLKLIEEKMGKAQSDATNTTNQLQLDITQGRNFNTGKD
tara:strand:+ start:201 stop:1655 length:1455 start_codon:yes stop_codon:yes gene_type:complete